MKLQIRRLSFRRRNQGYAALAMVAVIGITALLGLMYVFRLAMRSHESQVRNQVKIDYRQKEDALLRALVSIVPNKAIGAMMPNSAGSPGQFSWDTIFTEAIAASNTENALNAAVVSGFGISGIINANTGDRSLTANSDIIGVVAGDGTLVGPGNTANTGLLTDPDVMAKLPQALGFTGNYVTDQSYPIISNDKTYPAAAVGLGASAVDYPVYNLIPYPMIRLGLSAQGQNFIAKRNWWAFSLTFGNGINLTNNTGTAASAIPTVTKNYVLSIYEMPAQLALFAGAKARYGAYADGSAWQNTTITGSAFASEVEAVGLKLEGSGARLGARGAIAISGGTSVGGNSISAGFDALGARETQWATSGSDFYGASSAGDSGKVAILPLGQGEVFIRRDDAVPQVNSLSPTGWYEYATGSLQCKMGIEILKMDVAPYVNRPIKVRFHYFSGGVPTSVDYEKNINWENNDHDLLDNPLNPPFYWENLGITTNPCLTIKLDEWWDFLKNVLVGADGLDVNDSLAIWSNVIDASVSQPVIPCVNTDMAVVVRGGNDMTKFTNGFSIVTDHRVYIAEDINKVQAPNPDAAASGYPAGQPYYPPVSIYAAEKRFGTVVGAVDNLTLAGRLTSLQEDNGSTVNIMDFKTGTGTDGVTKTSITATLSQMVSPAELPPVNKMTWLVVLEEVQSP